jgi:hypothetical protein
MRPRTIGLFLTAWIGFAFCACSNSPSTATSSTSGSTGTGGAPNCDGLWFVDGDDGGTTCDICMRENCCAELAACGTEHCLRCATYGGVLCCGGGGGCDDVAAQWHPTRYCAADKCQPTCFPTCLPGFCPDGGDGG